MQNEKINPEQAYKTLMLIWLSLLVSQFLFPVLLYVIKPQLFRFDFTKPLFGDNGLVVAAIGVISLSNLFISFSLSKKYIDGAINAGSIALVQTALIVGCALCESVSIFGLALGVIFDYQYFFVFSILGIVGTLLHFPSRDNVHAASVKSGS